jgi:cytoskeletal protein RodZ
VSDNKVEGAGAPEIQLEASSVISGDGETHPGDAATSEAHKAPAATGQSNGGAQVRNEKASAAEEPDQSLGAFLIAAREGRGLSAEDVVRETRLPHHYLRMMETNDYSEISDQLYLVPFLRRYATFLELDQEDVAMRFIREVQRSDASPPPARLDQPLVSEPRRHRGWSGGILVLGLLVVAVGVYLYESDRHRQVTADALTSHASASVISGSDASGAGSSTTTQTQPPQ